jgi:hypothetical protein
VVGGAFESTHALLLPAHVASHADASRAVSRTGPDLVSASEDIIDYEMHSHRSEVLGTP